MANKKDLMNTEKEHNKNIVAGIKSCIDLVMRIKANRVKNGVSMSRLEVENLIFSHDKLCFSYRACFESNSFIRYRGIKECSNHAIYEKLERIKPDRRFINVLIDKAILKQKIIK